MNTHSAPAFLPSSSTQVGRPPRWHSRSSPGWRIPSHAALAVLWLILVMLVGCSRSGEGKEEAAKSSTVSSPKEGTRFEATVKLDAETQTNLHLKVEPLPAAKIPREVKGYGRVLDPWPLAELYSELATAQAELAASEKEYQRLKTLAAQDNASARALQAGLAAAERDRLRVQSTRQRIALSWGETILNRSDLRGLVGRLVAVEALIVRIDLPAGESLGEAPTQARIMTLRDETATGRFLSRAPTTTTQMQGQGFLFLLETNSLQLAPGSAVTGYLKLPGEPLRGVMVPRSAVVRYQQRAWVYVQTSPNTFERNPIPLTHPSGSGWFVTHPLKTDTRIVVDGAQVLLAEELKSQIQLKD